MTPYFILSPTARIRNPEYFIHGKHCVVDDFCYISTRIKLGDYFHIAANCSIAGGTNNTFRTGSFGSLASGVKVYCSSDDFTNDIATILPKEYGNIKNNVINGDVILGDYVTIGANSVILPGVSIPEGTTIGALSLITKNTVLEPWSVYAGIGNQVKKVGIRNKDNIIQQFIKIKVLEAENQVIPDVSIIQNKIIEKFKLNNRIDYFKDIDWIEKLIPYNTHLLEVGKKYKYYNSNYKLEKQEVSYWFNPNEIKNIPISDYYPFTDKKVSTNPSYKLILYAPNYLNLFLCNLLYADNKNIIIEDVGCGDGKLFYYLAHSGFHNFHGIDNFSECSYELFKDNFKSIQIDIPFNKFEEIEPVIYNNSSAPRAKSRYTRSMELLTYYWNSGQYVCEKHISFLNSMGFVYLCHDKDNLSIAFCRKDKYNEFIQKLIQYRIEI